METVKCNNMAELNNAIKEAVNLDLTSWVGGNIDLGGATVGDIDLQGATVGDINLWRATTDNINLEGAKVGDILLKGAKAGNINLGCATTGNILLQGATVGNINLQCATTRNIYTGCATIGNVYLQGATTGDISLEDAKTGDIYQNYTDEDLYFLRNLPLDIIDLMQLQQSNDNWLTAKDIHICGTTYCVRGYAEAQYFAKNGVKVEDKKSLYPNLKHLFFMNNEQFKAELIKITNHGS